VGRVDAAERLAQDLGASLAHRGPDDSGTKYWPAAGLVFRRLSILDLSHAGAQPMANEDGTVWVVFNGEIYNHHALRRELVTRGHVFRGHSDTEVLPHLYEEFGSEMLGRLRGMFALAVYDARKGELLLARDRFGIKPLFYTSGGRTLSFASELNTLRLAPGFDSTPDRQAISDYVSLSYVPAPATFYRGARAVCPGSMVVARFEGETVTTSTRAYHEWRLGIDTELPFAEARDRADQLLMNAVGRQLESDVPLGTLLSGGIDSSLVTAAAQAATADPVRSFNVQFGDSGYDETWAALAVAGHLRTEHQTFAMTGSRGRWREIVDTLLHVGQPYADSSLFPVNALSRFMRSAVTVALSGDGGDEAFGGYDSYRRLPLIRAWQHVPGVLRDAGATAAEILAEPRLVEPGLPRAMRELGPASDAGVLATLYSWVRPAEHRALLRDGSVAPVVRLFERTWPIDADPRDTVSRLSALTTEINVRLVLPNDYLFKVDIGSMKEGLEVRVPMLDEELFAFGLSLPHALKVGGGRAKRVLRAIARKRLPAPVWKKRKRGFTIPVDLWLDDDAKQQLRTYVNAPSSVLPEYLNRDIYAPMVDAFAEGRRYPGVSRAGLYTRALMLLSLQLHLSRAAGGRIPQAA
jgi:asparagine synthase (glutamine-hydrolysing)